MVRKQIHNQGKLRQIPSDFEDRTGSLEKGKLADIVVFEKNVLELADDRDEMFNMKVLMTMTGGNIVYGK